MSLPSTNATSASTRGWSRVRIEIGVPSDAVADVHVAEQVAEVGLVHAELTLDRLRGGADLATHHRHAPGEPALHQALLHGVSRGQVVGADEVTHRSARHPGLLGDGEALHRGRDRVLRGHEVDTRTCYSFVP